MYRRKIMNKIWTHHIGIEVKDMQKSIELYEAMGGVVNRTVDAKSIDKTLVFIEFGTTTIELISSDTDRIAHVAYYVSHKDDIPLPIDQADKCLYIPEINKVCYFFENETIEYMVPANAGNFVRA